MHELPSSFLLRRCLALLPLAFACTALLPAAQPVRKAKPTASTPLATWIEPDFPFFSSVLDARKAGAQLAPNNLTPRGLILNLGLDCWVCFDVDLLRVSAIWRGPGVTATALAPGSYHDVTRKTPGGQTRLPEPEGALWAANGIYPGWQAGTELSLADPREPAPSPEEIGRGGLPVELGRFDAIRHVGRGVVLEYTVAGTRIREQVTAADRNGSPVITRSFAVGAGTQPLLLAVGALANGATVASSRDDAAPAVSPGEGRIAMVRVPARAATLNFAVEHTPSSVATKLAQPWPAAAPLPRWPQDLTTSIKLSSASDAYVVDHVALPFDNPWRRGLRPADVQFLRDGTGVLITLDGDVWLARGLAYRAHQAASPVRWKRFASGLHEPMTIAIRDEQIHAFDKNGIWRLRDTNGDDEADVHELFSNVFGQTADMREFPSQIRLAPRGEFVIAKGGQQATTLGKHNGSVLRVSADGSRVTLLGYGLRQPNIGVNIRSGLVTSSDQQGQYIPSTPLHIVRDGQFYGYLAEFQPREEYPAPPAEPLTWIPHAVNASAVSQVWLFDARMGPLNGDLVHIGFNKPELFRVLFNHRAPRPQAAVVSVTRGFEFPPLNGSVSPADGQLYLAGFQVLGWGNVLDVPAGLGRVRYTGAPVTVPRELVPTDRGVLLRFDVALDPKQATDPASYSLQSWGYKRTYKYGSAQYKADGTPGQDAMAASAAYLSQDGRSVFIAVPGMKPVMQVRVGWSLATKAGQSFQDNAYTTPYALVAFDPQVEGFGDITIDLTPRANVVAQAAGPVSVEEGARVAQLFACVACHSTEDAGIVRAGPSWKNLFGSKRAVSIERKAQNVAADEAYLRESILDPTAKIAAGFEKGEYAMPSYAGVLSPSQIDSLILYIKSLK